MAHYQLRGAKMPWGDYGKILAFGMSRHLVRKDGQIQLERTRPFIPPISFPAIPDVVVTSRFREDLEGAGLSGLAFQPVAKVRIVELDWEKWDRTARDPKMYPPGSEPENYILSRPHSPTTANLLGMLWELIPREAMSVDAMPNLDVFRYGRVILVSKRAKDWFSQSAGAWVRFEEVRPSE
jgi:hypothetical protein